MESALGIIPGHMYTLLSVKEVEGVRYVELRNPWGKTEWKGAGGDYEQFKKDITKKEKEEAKKNKEIDEGMGFSDFKAKNQERLTQFGNFLDNLGGGDSEESEEEFAEDDGQFLMPFHDFFKIFKQVTFCYFENSFKTTSFADSLNKRTINCYKVTVTSPGEYYFSISQKDRRLKIFSEKESNFLPKF